MSKKTVEIPGSWKEVAFIISHPDDESMMWGMIELLISAGVSVTIILLTLGENGSKTEKKKKVKKRRKEEFLKATRSKQIESKILDLGDGSLSDISLKKLVKPVLKYVRKREFDALFSFHPEDHPDQFDHTDHNIAGLISQKVSEQADVRNYKKKYPAMKFRPDLWWWSQSKHLADHNIELDEELRKKRNEYLIDYYPSQFTAEEQPVWSGIFDTISIKKDGSHREYWRQVRRTQ